MSQESDREIHQAIGEAVARAEGASAATSIDPPETDYSIFDLKYALAELERRRALAAEKQQELEAAQLAAAAQEQKIGGIYEQLRKRQVLATSRFVIRQGFDTMQVEIAAIPNFGTLHYRITQVKLDIL